MENLPIQTIRIQGWRSIKDTTVTFGKINILIGANGAGKSSFLSVFELLRAIANNYLPLFSDKNGGANENFHYGARKTQTVTIEIALNNKTYTCTLIADNNDRIKITSSSYKCPNHEHLNVKYGGETTPYVSDIHEIYDSKTLSPLILYHFHDTGDYSPIKRTCDINENRYLFPDGANLAAILYKIQHTAPEHYQEILYITNLIFPEFKDFIFDKTGDYLKLRWQDKNSPDYTFPLSALSDGTLRFIALTTLLMQPNPPEVIIIDEPELGLHPKAIAILAELIQLASDKSQIIISTQSVELINHFKPEDILVTENRLGETEIKRQTTEELQDWLEDYTLGDLWQKNLLGGNP